MKEFSESLNAEELAKRCAIIERLYGDFLNNLPENIPADSFRLNRRLVLEAIKSYFFDMERVRRFHGIEHPNRSKISGYTAFWLAKTRCIQLVSDKLDEPSVYINEMFSVFVYLAFLEVSSENVPPHLYLDLLYDMHFSVPSKELLSILGSSLIEIDRLNRGDSI